MQVIYHRMKVKSFLINTFVFWGVLLGSHASAQLVGSSSLTRDEINEHLNSGEVLDYELIVSKIPREENDRFIEVELISFDGYLIYYFQLLKENGVVETHLIDGRTGEDASHLRDE